MSQENQSKAPNKSMWLGFFYAMVVLIGNGIHPIINNMKPSDFDALIFAWMMSFWELLGAIPLYFIIKSRNKRKNALEVAKKDNNEKNTLSLRDKGIILLIGIIFAIATYYYILGLTLAGSVSGSIALKSAPIYSLIIGVIFLKEKLHPIDVLITLLMLIGLFYLATAGTFAMTEFSLGFAILLLVPLMWTIGHAMSKPYLVKGLISTPTLIIVRTGIVFVILFVASLFVIGWGPIYSILTGPIYVGFSALMGLTYLFMHYCWYKSISTLELSTASALVIPSPAITTILALLITQEEVHAYHIIGMLAMFIGLYSLIFIKSKRKKAEKMKKSEKNEIL
jgi:drug/metabolite transporter (DMT)-like permease